MLPPDVVYNGLLWTLHESVTPEANVCVEYVHEGELFPVAFVEKTADEARLLMLAWLQWQGVN